MKQKKYFICVLYALLGFMVQGVNAQNVPFAQYNGDRFALIDAKTFKPLTPYKYESMGTFQDGLALSTFRSEAGKLQYTFVNMAGKEIVPPTAERMFAFAEGKARFKQGNKFGYLNPQGKVVIPARFIEAREYKEGRAFVRDEDKNAMFIDEQGNAVVRFQEDFNCIRDFQDGLAMVGNCDNLADKGETEDIYFNYIGSFSFYDKQGKQVFGIKGINSDLNHTSNFEKGVAIVAFINPNYDTNSPTMYGAINQKGKLIIPLEYSHIDRTKDGALLLQKYNPETYQSVYGLADATGKIFMPCEYQFIFEPIGNYRVFQQRKAEQNPTGEYDPYLDRYGIADLQGKILVKPTYKDIYLHKNGNFLALDSVAYEPMNDITGMQQSTLYYIYKNIAGKTLASMVEVQKLQNYEELTDGEEGSIEYRTGELVPITFHNKWALVNNEKHEIATDFYDELAPFISYFKGERLAYREGKKWGYLNEQLEPITKLEYEYAANYGEGNYAPVKKNNKWALINKTGQEVTAYSFDSIVPNISRIRVSTPKIENQMEGGNQSIYLETLRSMYLPAGYFIAKKANQWGIINWDGQTVLPFQYEGISDAFYNYVIISKGDTKGLVDYAGKELIPTQYNTLKVVNDLVYARENGKEGLFDLQHNTIAKPIYDTIFTPVQNFIRVVKDKKTGYLDHTGKEMLAAMYDEVIGQIGRGYSVTLIQNGKFGVANGDLKIIVPCEYDSLLAEDWRKYIWVKKNNLYGLLNFDGKIAHPIQYDFIDNLEKEAYNGNPRVLLAQRNKKWGILDTTGKAIVPFEYDYMRLDYEKKQAVVSKKGKWGSIKSSGQVVIPFKYDEIGHIYQDIPLIGIKKKGKWGYLNAAGKEIIAPQFQDAGAFANVMLPNNNTVSYASVKKGKYWGIIDNTGKTVVPFQFDMIEAIPYSTNQPLNVWRNGTQEQVDFKGEPYKGE